MPSIAAKGRALTDFAHECCDELNLESITPRDSSKRGAHIAVRHPHAKMLLNVLNVSVRSSLTIETLISFGSDVLHSRRGLVTSLALSSNSQESPTIGRSQLAGERSCDTNRSTISNMHMAFVDQLDECDSTERAAGR